MQGTRLFMGLLLALALSGAFAADGMAPADFRGLNWGAAPTKSLKRVSGPTGSEKLSVWTTQTQNLPPYSGVPVAEESYLFENNKLYSGQLYFDGADNLAKLKGALATQFGKPDFANNSLQVFRWKWATSRVEVTLTYQSKFQRTTVSLTKE